MINTTDARDELDKRQAGAVHRGVVKLAQRVIAQGAPPDVVGSGVISAGVEMMQRIAGAKKTADLLRAAADTLEAELGPAEAVKH